MRPQLGTFQHYLRVRAKLRRLLLAPALLGVVYLQQAHCRRACPGVVHSKSLICFDGMGWWGFQIPQNWRRPTCITENTCAHPFQRPVRYMVVGEDSYDDGRSKEGGMGGALRWSKKFGLCMSPGEDCFCSVSVHVLTLRLAGLYYGRQSGHRR